MAKRRQKVDLGFAEERARKKRFAYSMTIWMREEEIAKLHAIKDYMTEYGLEPPHNKSDVIREAIKYAVVFIALQKEEIKAKEEQK